MASRYRKRCSPSLIIRDIQIKTTMTYSLIPVKIVIIKRKQKRNPKNQEIILAGCREKSESLYTAGGKVYLYSHYEKQCSIPQEITNRNTI